MQILIYKTELQVEHAPRWLAPTTPVLIVPEADGTVSAYVERPRGWLRLFRRDAVRIGALSGQARDLLAPALETGAPLRVRIVEVVQAHHTPDERTRVAVSVWGDPNRLIRPACR